MGDKCRNARLDHSAANLNLNFAAQHYGVTIKDFKPRSTFFEDLVMAAGNAVRRMPSQCRLVTRDEITCFCIRHIR